MLTVNNYSVQNYGTTFKASMQSMISFLKRHGRYNKKMDYPQVKSAYEQLRSELAMQKSKQELTSRETNNFPRLRKCYIEEKEPLPDGLYIGKIH